MIFNDMPLSFCFVLIMSWQCIDQHLLPGTWQCWCIHLCCACHALPYGQSGCHHHQHCNKLQVCWVLPLMVLNVTISFSFTSFLYKSHRSGPTRLIFDYYTYSLTFYCFLLLTHPLFYNLPSHSFICITNIFYDILPFSTLFPWLHHRLLAQLYKPSK